ncbi:hypothetical protein [Methanosarcina mazei]|uniref:hypothetical protein n=1 Tax=Methanosarcina mazei TaxID=2209 RepID=UPI001F1BECE2|nr:hypothetical protein [Methanosarcina mazei]
MLWYFAFTSSVLFASPASRGNIWSAEMMLSRPNSASYHGTPAEWNSCPLRLMRIIFRSASERDRMLLKILLLVGM